MMGKAVLAMPRLLLAMQKPEQHQAPSGELCLFTAAQKLP